MADDPKATTPPTPPPAATPPTPDGSASAPLAVTIVGAGQPGGPVVPIFGMDETVPGGAYRHVGLDGSETYKDADGNEVSKPKSK